MHTPILLAYKNVSIQPDYRDHELGNMHLTLQTGCLVRKFRQVRDVIEEAHLVGSKSIVSMPKKKLAEAEFLRTAVNRMRWLPAMRLCVPNSNEPDGQMRPEYRSKVDCGSLRSTVTRMAP